MPVIIHQMPVIFYLNRKRMLSAIIISDCWKVYNRLETEGYKHLTVNCFYNFVDLDNRVYIQNIERIQRDIHDKHSTIWRYSQAILHRVILRNFSSNETFYFLKLQKFFYYYSKILIKKQTIFLLISIYFDECRMHGLRLPSCTSRTPTLKKL